MASKESSRKQFLHAILQEDLAETDKDLLSELIDRDLPSSKREIGFVSPRYTTAFLNMFEDAEEFKCLTHKYNGSTEDAEDHMPHTNKSMRELALRLFAERTKINKETESDVLPGNLYKCFEGFLKGPFWYDSQRKKHTFNWSSDDFIRWAEQNPTTHPGVSTSPFRQDIEAFKHTIKIRERRLGPLIDELLEKNSITTCNKEGLFRAEFYTFVPALKDALDRIFSGIKERETDVSSLNICYRNAVDPITKKRVALIEILHENSFSGKSIEDCQDRLRNGMAGGDFGEIKKSLKGYANWTVESLWAGEPRRWRILDDTKSNEIETMSEGDVKGFKHIITIYR